MILVQSTTKAPKSGAFFYGRVGSGRVKTMPSWAWPPGVGGRYVRTRLEAGLKKKGGLGPLKSLQS